MEECVMNGGVCDGWRSVCWVEECVMNGGVCDG